MNEKLDKLIFYQRSKHLKFSDFEINLKQFRK